MVVVHPNSSYYVVGCVCCFSAIIITSSTGHYLQIGVWFASIVCTHFTSAHLSKLPCSPFGGGAWSAWSACCRRTNRFPSFLAFPDVAIGPCIGIVWALRTSCWNWGSWQRNPLFILVLQRTHHLQLADGSEEEYSERNPWKWKRTVLLWRVPPLNRAGGHDSVRTKAFQRRERKYDMGA